MGIYRHRLERTVASRWFGLADLAAVMAAASLWFAMPERGPLPLLIALSPWIIRILAGRRPFRITGLELPFAIFLIMAAVGVWAAYDTGSAWAKFWILVSAVLMFYSLSAQPVENTWLIVGFFGFVGFGVAAYFLLSHDWTLQETKLPIITRLGEGWMQIRPWSTDSGIGPNGAAGLMAMTFPLLAALGVYQARRGRRLGSILVAAALALLLLGLVGTSSRGAWIALAAGVVAWGAWVLSSWLAARAAFGRSAIFTAFVVVAALSAGLVLAVSPSFPVGVLNSVPGPPSAGSRLQLARDTIDLIGDFPFTGGGLQSFPGLYSQYIQNIPHLLVDYSHNLYLNVALEQGLVGLAAFASVIVAALTLLISAPTRRDSSDSLLRGALIAGFTAMLLHGLVTDVLYGIQGTPIVFLFPGLAYLVSRPVRESAFVAESGSKEMDPGVRSRLSEYGGAAVLIVVLAISIQGARQANLGAVEMAKVELAEWPTGKWDDGSQVAELSRAEATFIASLAASPTLRTSNHRLGMIYMLQRDYARAADYLEVAHAEDPSHRGIRKALGQSYAWSGNLRQAVSLLAALPESSSEMTVYQWWWGTQGRADLAEIASTMAVLLNQGADATSDVDF